MCLTNISVRQAESVDRTPWNDYVARHQDGLAYHFFAWKDAVENSYGFNSPYFLAVKDDQIVGVLPTTHVHLPINNKGSLISLPYCDAGGILADCPETIDMLFKYACNYALERRISRIEIRSSINYLNQCNHENINLLNSISENSQPEMGFHKKVRMLLDLPKDSNELFSTFKSKLRSQIKKPDRDGLIVKIGGSELIADFYSVFVENMKSLGSPVHSRKWLCNIFKYFGDRAKCGVVFMPDKTPAAGGIILCHDNVVSLPWASSLRRLNNFSPNMLLYWTFLKYAADNGYRCFDFGRSTPGEGTYNFKAQWGAKPHPLFWRQWEITKNRVFLESPSKILNSNNFSRDMAEKIIQKMPLTIATFLGSKIRKYISL
jgi:FemAB-related protein (PEP-CTERM system-associated)